MRSQTVPTQVSIPLTFPLKTEPNSSLTEMISRVMQSWRIIGTYHAAANGGKFLKLFIKYYGVGISQFPWSMGSV